MITVERKKLTYADYAQLEEGAPYQLIDGELVMSPSPSPHHQFVLRRLTKALESVIEKTGAGEFLFAPIDVRLSEHNTFQPDIAFVTKERMDIIGPAKIDGAPDLVIEVLSPATAHLDVRTKKDAYERFGVKEYWIVDPMRRTIAIFENREGEFQTVRAEDEEGTATSRIVAGFEVNVEQLFAGLGG